MLQQSQQEAGVAMAFLNEYEENELDTQRLLYAVGNLDELRSILADIEPTEPYHAPRPPEIREKLMKLHRLVFNNGFAASRDKLCEADVLRDEIDSELGDILAHAERIKNVLWDLHKAMPEFTEAEYDAVFERLDAEADA